MRAWRDLLPPAGWQTGGPTQPKSDGPFVQRENYAPAAAANFCAMSQVRFLPTFTLTAVAGEPAPYPAFVSPGGSSWRT